MTIAEGDSSLIECSKCKNNWWMPRMEAIILKIPDGRKISEK